ncbi:hypothetical protein SLA2020_333770 [Shorea laevis]
MPGKLGCVIIAVEVGEESMAALRCLGGPSAAGLEVPAFLQAIEARQKRIAKAILHHALEICTGKNGITEMFIGDPKEKTMFLGSVSNYCFNHAQCPVFLAKNKNNTS